jgi:hypothetical protein
VRYVRQVIRIRDVARGYWFELLIGFLAIAGMLELVVGRDSPGAPPATLWIAVPAVAVLVLPLFARRRFPFAAPLPIGSWPRRSRSATDCCSPSLAASASSGWQARSCSETSAIR